MNDNDFYPGFLVGIIIGSMFTALGLIWSIENHGYDDGYCKALGGTTITTEVCDVDGKVVKIND